MTQPSAVRLPSAVRIREVGPRDGLQAEAPVAPPDRVRLIAALVAAGCTRIEAASFVSEKAVPAMAGAREVIDGVRGLQRESRLGKDVALYLTALVPNLRGAEAALETEVDELTVTVAASEEYNQRNVRRSIAESVEEIARVAQAAGAAGPGGTVPVDAVISCAFGSPYEGDIPADQVADLTARLLDSGATAVTLADTTGMATPRVLNEVLQATARRLPSLDPGLHLHETRGTALLNAYAAMELGVTRFDTAVGGLGGSPFAKGAGGNLATEDFVTVLDDLGITTGIDLMKLLETTELLSELVGHPPLSKVSLAGPRLVGGTEGGG